MINIVDRAENTEIGNGSYTFRSRSLEVEPADRALVSGLPAEGLIVRRLSRSRRRRRGRNSYRLSTAKHPLNNRVINCQGEIKKPDGPLRGGAAFSGVPFLAPILTAPQCHPELFHEMSHFER